jgi:hypothetical protein
VIKIQTSKSFYFQGYNSINKISILIFVIHQVYKCVANNFTSDQCLRIYINLSNASCIPNMFACTPTSSSCWHQFSAGQWYAGDKASVTMGVESFTSGWALILSRAVVRRRQSECDNGRGVIHKRLGVDPQQGSVTMGVESFTSGWALILSRAVARRRQSECDDGRGVIHKRLGVDPQLGSGTRDHRSFIIDNYRMRFEAIDCCCLFGS